MHFGTRPNACSLSVRANCVHFFHLIYIFSLEFISPSQKTVETSRVGPLQLSSRQDLPAERARGFSSRYDFFSLSFEIVALLFRILKWNSSHVEIWMSLSILIREVGCSFQKGIFFSKFVYLLELSKKLYKI